MKFSLETMREVWDDEAAGSGDYVEIGPDRDALGLVELRCKHDDKIIERMAFAPAQALLIAQAITACACELTGKKL
jgi:hypothetical protein